MKTLLQDITDVLNRHSIENRSGTPDYILAMFLEGCLLTFDTAVQQRETWHGRDSRPLEKTATLAADSAL